MKTYQTNMADQALVVKSLKVLDKMEGDAVREIQKTVEAVRKTQNIQLQQQEQYWKALSDDGIITPIEKQELLRETKSIDRSYVAITQQAQALGIQSSLLSDYTATYNALHNYLYTTLKLFDNMTEETAIDDRDTFNGYFSNYYFAENFVLLAITSGILETMNIRVLESLDEEGEEGETAIYHGGLYQYTGGHWQNVITGAYKGARSQLPLDEEGAFFIASDDFFKLEVLLVNGEELYVNGDQLGILGLCRKGYIYYCEEGVWYEESDKTNWRYAAAFADVINITGELPQLFQDSIDALQYEINDLVYDVGLKASQTALENEIAAREGQYTIVAGELLQINGDIQDIVDEYNQQQTQIDSKVSHLPVYYGQTIPDNPQEGDFYLYTGIDDNRGKIRRYHNGAWEWLENPAQNDAYRNYYMMALQDILEIEEASEGYFSELFAAAFWTNKAVINKLETKIIYLQYGGEIRSSNVGYSEEHYGLRIDYDGNIDANGNVHMGGDAPIGGTKPKVAIGVPLKNNPDFNTYDAIIGGNTKITGKLVGCDVYCNKIGFYNLAAGANTAWVESIAFPSASSGAQTLSKKIRFSPCCYDSSVRLQTVFRGAGGGDTYSHPEVSLSIYYKINGSVSTGNYDYYEHAAYNEGTSGTYYTLQLSKDISFTDAIEYVEILLIYNVVGIVIPPEAKIYMGLSEYNPLAGRFAVFQALT